MPLRDRIVLAHRLGRTLVDVGLDAVGPALPLSPAPLADPLALGRLLREHACDVGAPPPRPRTVVNTSLQAPSSNCQNTLLGVEWEDPPAAAAGAEPPRSLFVKQASQDFGTRVFAHLVGFWRTECAFCQRLANDLPIPAPRVHAVAQRRSRFVIVMENLAERPETRLFVNRDLLKGAGIERARRCLRTLAQLHAGFAHWTPAMREERLPEAIHPLCAPDRAALVLALNRLAVDSCHRRLPYAFDEVQVALYRRAIEHWDLLRDAWFGEPQTLVHGDSHLGNFFETRTGGEPSMGMFDFQGVHWGSGVRDVQYFLTNSLRPDVLASHEKELLAEYTEEVTRLGAPLGFDEAWERYRGFAFHPLMTAVVSIGLGSFTDSDDVMRMMLERAVAATRRLGFDSWLQDRIGLAGA